MEWGNEGVRTFKFVPGEEDAATIDVLLEEENLTSRLGAV